MKSKKQIIEYVNSKPWRDSFVRQSFLSQNKLRYDLEFIVSGFDWESSEEGSDYWSNVDSDYRNWYVESGKPKSWEEFCEQNPIGKEEAMIRTIDSEIIVLKGIGRRFSKRDKTLLPSKEYAEAFLAYMQLIQLRKAWLKGNTKPLTYKIETGYNKPIIVGGSPWNKNEDDAYSGLSFPTWNLANDFLTTFSDLLEKAKILL